MKALPVQFWAVLEIFSPLKGTALGNDVDETKFKDQLLVKYFLS